MKHFALCALLCSLNAFASEKTCQVSFSNLSDQDLTIELPGHREKLPAMESTKLYTIAPSNSNPQSVVALWTATQAKVELPLTYTNANDFVVYNALVFKGNGKVAEILHSDPTLLLNSSER